MNFLSLDQMPGNRPDIEFKTSSMNSMIGLLTIIAMICMGLFAPIGTMRFPWLGMCLLFLLLPLNMLIKERRSTNWLLRVRGDLLWIKFRSYENDKLPTDQEQIVQIDRSEIESVRCVKKTRITSIHDKSGVGFERRVFHYLELILSEAGTDALEVRLDRERQREHWWDNPVQVTGPRAIWIRWSSSSDRIKPGMTFALKWFSKWTNVLPMASSEDDFLWTTLEKASSEEQHAKLKSLYSQDPVRAVQTMQLLRRCSPSDAEKYLNQVAAQLSTTQ